MAEPGLSGSGSNSESISFLVLAGVGPLLIGLSAIRVPFLFIGVGRLGLTSVSLFRLIFSGRGPNWAYEKE